MPAGSFSRCVPGTAPIGNGNREIARHHPERQDEDHENPRMDGTSSHERPIQRDELTGIFGMVCGKIFWQARGTGFQPVESHTGKMPVPRRHLFTRKSCRRRGMGQFAEV